jgi:REP element-mobilizing transposase RayT
MTENSDREKKKLRLLIPRKQKKRRRILGKGPISHYHVVTQFNASMPDLEKPEMAYFRGLLERVSGFCGVAVRAFCLEPDQIQLLVAVSSGGDLADREIIERARMIYPKRAPQGVISQEWVEAALAEGGEVREAMRAHIAGRMASLSMFMKILKQRFALLYNRSHERYGTIWAELYRSTLVENAPRPLATVAAYIDLRPVRTHLVDNPVDYPFSSLGETWKQSGSLEGHPVFDVYLKSERLHRTEMEETYRYHTLIGAPKEIVAKKRAAAREGEEEANTLTLPRSGIIGSPAFVENWIREHKSLYFPKHTKRPKKIPGEDRDDGVHSLR